MTARWLCSVTFLKDGKYPMPSVVYTLAAAGPHTAPARALAGARKATMRGKRVDEVTVKVKRVPAVQP